jgi:hypothetical protein
MTKTEQKAYDAMFDAREYWMARALRAEEKAMLLSKQIERYRIRLEVDATNGALDEEAPA